jgi:hypothetical protein
MKDIIRMNQLAGLITENQAQKMMEILDEKETTNELFGLGAKIEVRDKTDKNKMVKVGTGDLVAFNPQYDNTGYANDNEGVYTITQIKGDNIILKKADNQYQTPEGRNARDISGAAVKASSLAYYGKK